MHPYWQLGVRGHWYQVVVRRTHARPNDGSKEGCFSHQARVRCRGNRVEYRHPRRDAATLDGPAQQARKETWGKNERPVARG